MSETELEAAILLADVSGSTQLYEIVGDVAAYQQIVGCLDDLRSIARRLDGLVIHSKGDDLLCAFADPAAALTAVREMLSRDLAGPLAIHAGLHFGSVIHARGDIYGDSVNLTARLTQLANPGEVLLSESFVRQLSPADARSVRVLDNVTFKGKSAPTEIYSLMADESSSRTAVDRGHGTGHTRTRHQRGVRDLSVTLHYDNDAYRCTPSGRLVIGRSSDCDLVIQRPWVSRQHATMTLRRGRAELSDQSSSGTYVALSDGYDFFMRRETVLLTGNGIISPTRRPTESDAQVVRFEIKR